jgi:ABC-type transporter Mla subunit MlaD
MSAKANYFKIGLFVIGAVVIGMLALVILGSGRLLHKRVTAETYINESVQGLDVGSAVRYRGVQIGNVTDMDFVHNQYPVEAKLGVRYVLIRMTLDPSAFGVGYGNQIDAFLRNEIKSGLRVRMSAQGLTGSSYLEMDYMDPERNPPLAISWQPLHYYVPSATSTIARMSESIEKILQKLEATQFETVVNDLHGLITTMQKEIEGAKLGSIHDEIAAFLEKASGEVKSAKLGKLHDEMSALLKGLGDTNEALQKIVKDPRIDGILAGTHDLLASKDGEAAKLLADLVTASQKIGQTLDNLNGIIQSKEVSDSLGHLKSTLQRADLILSNQQQSIDLIFENLSRASEDFRALVREARQYPSGFLFGEPPTASPKEKK